MIEYEDQKYKNKCTDQRDHFTCIFIDMSK